MLEKYDPNTDVQYRAQLEADDLPASMTTLSRARLKWLLTLIKAIRCYAAECCAAAKEMASSQDTGSLLILGTQDDTQELNNEPAAPMLWDDEHQVGDDFEVSANPLTRGRVTVQKDDWYRIYTLVTYSSLTADTSIGVQVELNGALIVPGIGRHGYIKAGVSGHNRSSSSIEAWVELVEGDQIRVATSRNGAAGAVNPVAGECLLIIERRPLPPGSTS